jgi:prepilin signal peptidase PulO-like enzyme (type II secretory pathway)
MLYTTPYIISGAVIVLLAFFAGAAIGSFIGVVIERGPRGAVKGERSHCACGRPLKWYENIPIFGWLRIGGRTRCCNTKLPVWYLLLEIAGGLLVAIPAYLLIF